MRLFSLIVLVAALVVGTALSASAATTFIGDVLTLDVGGKTITLKEEADELKVFSPDPRIRMVSFFEDDIKAAKLKTPTVFFFDKAGALIGKLEDNKPFPLDEIGDFSLSPKGDILAIDTGTFVIRNRNFFAFPSLKPLDSTVTYVLSEGDDPDLSNLAWVDNNQVIVSTLTESGGKPGERQCGYDPCGFFSVVLFDISAKKTSPIFTGDNLCDYFFTSLKDKTVTAQKSCADKVERYADPGENADFFKAVPVTHTLP